MVRIGEDMDNAKKNSYIAIDLKSFYASVECQDLSRDPLTTNLVVADRSRTSKTICLAVSPSLKKWGIPGRARLFEVDQRVEEINKERLRRAPGRHFTGESDDDEKLMSDPSLKLSFIAAVPHMARYMQISTKIYQTYLKYVAPEDIHVYSIDEVFIDVAKYLSMHEMTPRQLASRMIQDVWNLTGITATAGIGTNLYLCKVAMDVMAKHVEPDENGLRIAELDELSYRKKLWTHEPITDFWRVGKGYAKKLAAIGLYTMGDIARCSLGGERDFHNEELLYKTFGINAELLIDHAWGYEPCTMELIKAYKPDNNSLSQGQVLHCAYTADKARIVVAEMADALALQLMDSGLVTDQVTLYIGYDRESLDNPEIRKKYKGKVTTDYYGRSVPEHAHGSANIGEFTCLSRLITDAVLKIYDEHVNQDLLVRRITLGAIHVISEAQAREQESKASNYEQMSLFVDYSKRDEEQKNRKEKLEKEKALQEATLQIQKKFGKNAILKGLSYEEGATGRDRNNQIGGHKA